MTHPATGANHPTVDFNRLLHTRLGRATARLVICALLLTDLPLPQRYHAVAEATGSSSYQPRITGLSPSCVARGANFQLTLANFDRTSPLTVKVGGVGATIVSHTNLSSTTKKLVVTVPQTAPPGLTTVTVSNTKSQSASKTLRVRQAEICGNGVDDDCNGRVDDRDGSGRSCPIVNRPPTAHAGPDQTRPVGATVRLTACGSSDRDGDRLSFSWSFVAKPAGSTATLKGATTTTPTFVIDKPGVYTVKLTVSDGRGGSATDTVVISTTNSAPVANAGPDQSGQVGTTLTLDGSASSDADGNPLTYQWSLVSKPAGSTAALVNPTAVRPTLTLDKAGDYVVRLLVNDGKAASAPDTVKLSTVNSQPLANAGPDQSGKVGARITLDGSASSDADGDTLTHQWSLISQPDGSSAALSNATSIRPSLTPDKAGTYVVQLIVNDGLGSSEPDTVILSTTNSAPVAKAGAAQSGRVGTVIRLTGSASSDADGNPLTYRWSFTSVPTGSTAVLQTPTTVAPQFTLDRAGTYVVELIVNDGQLDSEPDTVTISTENSPPVAKAGPDQSVLLGQVVSLDGSASSDVDGQALTFAWSLTSAPTGSTATVSDPSAVKPTIQLDKTGQYTLQLVVNDGTIDSEPDTVVISTQNSPPVANAGPDQTVALTTRVVLNGSQSSDADGNPLTYRWMLMSVPTGSGAVLDVPTSLSPSFIADMPGSYTAQLIVNDGTVDSAPDTVVISTQNSQPVANAGPPQTVTVGQLVTLDGRQSSDADGQPLTYLWAFTNRPASSTAALSSAAAPQPTFTPDQPGLYVVQLIVNDGTVSSAPSTVSITANPVVATNRPPVANAGSDQSVSVGATVNLNGSGSSDPDNDPLTYQWTFTVNPASSNATLTGATTATPSFIADVAGPYSVQLTVSDGRGGSVSDSVDITATLGNRAPTITSTAVTTAAVGQAYSYDVNATDPDNDTLTYALTTKPTGMTIDATTGVITWTPAANQTGPQNVAVQVSDGHTGGTATQNFTIQVSASQANRAPTAQDDQYVVRRRQTLTVAAPGVLQNDSDPDNNPLTAQSVTNPTKGTATLAADGSFTYTPTEPLANSLEPVLKFSFGQGSTLTQPIVIDLDKDGVPEIVFRSNEGLFLTGNLIALHGNDGSVAFSTNAFQTTTNPQIVLDGSSELAAGDIDGDGFPEIIAVDGHDGNNQGTDSFRQQLIAFNHDGTYKWTSHNVVEDPLIDSVNTGSDGFTKPLIADLNGDGTPEIIVGYSAKGPLTPAGIVSEDYVTVFDNQGQILWTARGGGSNSSTGVVVAQDIDLDGDLEILFSDDVFDHQGHLLWSASPCLTCLNVIDVAVANLDDDPFAEIVYLDRFGQLYVYEHTGVKKWGPLDTGDAASNLTIGDVDGDGKSEIVVMTGTNIHVVARDGSSDRLIPIPFTAGNNSNGPTIFDLNGDGKPELIVPAATSPFDTGVGTGAVQQGALSIFDGQTGTQLYSIRSPNFSNRHEYPVVADVDGDGSAEIVTGGFNGSPLIHVFKAKNGKWAKTRPIYNQYNYNVTNVNSDGTVPAHPAINGLTPGLNNYRVNSLLPQERTGVDTDNSTYKANDGSLDSNTATVKIDILPPNTAPSILSQAPTTATPNLEYLYAVRAVDPDVGEVLTFALAQAPPGMTINSSTGLVRWTPTTAQAGNYIVALKVTDSQNQSAFQGFTITVGAQGTVPNVVGQTQAAAQIAITGAGLTVGTITNTPSNTVPAGSVISQEPAAGTSVPQGSAVNLVVSSGVQGATVPNVVSQTQAAAQTAITGVGLTVGTVTTAPSTTVAAGNIISQTPAAGTVIPLGSAVNFVVSTGVISLTGLTSIVVEPLTPLILVGNTQAFTATGIFNDGSSQNLTAIVTWTSSSPSAASIAVNGIATGLADGTTTITATSGTISGNTTLTVRAKVSGDTTNPTATITTPTDGAAVTSPIDVIGTASDANFLKYVLEYAPAGETTFTLLATGTSAVTNGVLGKLDPTLLINDLYTLRLTVFDRGGNQSVASVTVQVTREQKVGLFSITFQDLSIPLSGIPITINRTYDSRDKGKGDFGIGWRLDIQTLRLRPNREQGSGWVVNHPSGLSYTLAPVGEHKVSLTLPDGKVEEFDLVINPTSSALQPFTAVTASYIPRSGTVGTLIPLDNGGNTGLLITDPQIFAVNDVTLLDDSTLNTFNPKRFRYVSASGQLIDIDRTKGVEMIHDPNGNTLTFGTNGIIHSSGKSVTFTRDAQGRITQITDPSGNGQTYAYNANGDLVSHTDAVGTARYAYNSTHGLIDIQDPAGNHAARNEYDAQGRLIATTDAQGNRIEFTHDTAASREVVRDRLGNPTVFEYDATGNVTAKTDALAGRTTYTYDSQGNQLTETDPLGRVATKTYDSQRNVLTSTDFDGNTTTNTYNARQQILTTRDPEGRTTTNVYDANGNLTQVTDPEGGVTRHTYNAAGNRLTTTDPLGNVTTYTYDTAGDKTSETDPLGTVTTFTYNASGRVVSETKGGRTTQFQYDAAQRLTKVIDALNHQIVTTYSAVGDGRKPATVTDADGGVTTSAHDARGNLTGKTFPDGSTETTTYDAENHVLSVTDRDGHTTAYQYDALGRQTKITNPDGTRLLKAYDAVGRLLTQTDERDNVTTYSYAPNKQAVTDALGHVTVHEVDSQQRRTKTTDALGHVTTFAYDSAGNLLRITFPNGTTKTTSDDAAKRKTGETDQAGRTIQFAYDTLGQLIRVTDAVGSITTYTYDALGNRLTQADANNHTTQMTYDVLGHLLSRSRPLGQQESFTYDGNGNQLTHTDFNGQTTTFTYDAANRLTQKTLPGGTTVSYAFTGSGLRTQAGGDSYTYDTRGRLTQERKASGEVLSYTYDAAGNRTAVTTPQGTTTYTYDALNRLATVVDTTGTTTYTYDTVGNLASTAYPNGVTTTYGYDTLNRLLQMTNTGPAGLISSYTYTLGPAGNRLQVVEAGPATTGRTVSYTYDAVYRLTQEVIDEPGTANDQTIAYSYDAVGNRAQMNRTGDVTTYTYDANDRLLTETAGTTTATSTYDANGNLVSRQQGAATDTYTYDAENRLISASVQTGTNPGSVTYTYDADGMRTGKTAGAVTATFLLDKNRALSGAAISCGCKSDEKETVAQVLVETTGTTAVTYTYGHGLINQTRTGTGTRFYQYDGQLSTRQLTSTTGGVTDSYTYDAFGVLVASTGATPNVYLYVGEQLDPNVGFYYLRARYYSQATGRFITTDPEEGNIFDPVSLHRYLYANADPIDNWDPSGRNTLGELLVTNALRISLAVAFLNFVGTAILSKDFALAASTSFGVFFNTLFVIGTAGVGLEAVALVQAAGSISTRLVLQILRGFVFADVPGEIKAADFALSKLFNEVIRSKRARCYAIRALMSLVIDITIISPGTTSSGAFLAETVSSLDTRGRTARGALFIRLEKLFGTFGCPGATPVGRF